MGISFFNTFIIHTILITTKKDQSLVPIIDIKPQKIIVEENQLLLTNCNEKR